MRLESVLRPREEEAMAAPTNAKKLRGKKVKAPDKNVEEAKEEKDGWHRSIYALKGCSEQQTLEKLKRQRAIVVNRDKNAAKNILHIALRMQRGMASLAAFNRTPFVLH